MRLKSFKIEIIHSRNNAFLFKAFDPNENRSCLLIQIFSILLITIFREDNRYSK